MHTIYTYTYNIHIHTTLFVLYPILKLASNAIVKATISVVMVI